MKGKSFVDLGSGDGRTVILAHKMGAEKAVGIEFEGELLEISESLKRDLAGDAESIEFKKGDFLKEALGEYDIIFYNLTGTFDEDKLIKKIRKEMRPGALFVMYKFWNAYKKGGKLLPKAIEKYETKIYSTLEKAPGFESISDIATVYSKVMRQGWDDAVKALERARLTSAEGASRPGTGYIIAPEVSPLAAEWPEGGPPAVVIVPGKLKDPAWKIKDVRVVYIEDPASGKEMINCVNLAKEILAGEADEVKFVAAFERKGIGIAKEDCILIKDLKRLKQFLEDVGYMNVDTIDGVFRTLQSFARSV